MAFQEFTSLCEIVISPSVRAIKEEAFYRCLGLIRKKAFASCRLLHEIVIPPAIRVIKESAFEYCSELMIVFLTRGWW
jgi:hypothetical protein